MLTCAVQIQLSEDYGLLEMASKAVGVRRALVELEQRKSDNDERLVDALMMLYDALYDNAQFKEVNIARRCCGNSVSCGILQAMDVCSQIIRLNLRLGRPEYEAIAFCNMANSMDEVGGFEDEDIVGTYQQAIRHARKSRDVSLLRTAYANVLVVPAFASECVLKFTRFALGRFAQDG